MNQELPAGIRPELFFGKKEEEKQEGCRVTQVQVFPGILLFYYDIHAEHLDYDGSGLPFPEDLISIQHCREGRFEGEYADGEFVYLGEGDLSVNIPETSPVRNAYPLSHYHGLNLVIGTAEAEKSLKELSGILGTKPVNLGGIRQRLGKGNRLILFRSDPMIENIVSGLYCRGSCGGGFIRLRVLELLLYLSRAEHRESREKPYFFRNQVQAGKQIGAHLKAHPEERITLADLSKRFGIPLTSMKQCFKGVYGTSPGVYLRQYRMELAARLLLTTSLPAAEIGLRVGYESPSKFSAVFSRQMGCTPGEYRKSVVQTEQNTAGQSTAHERENGIVEAQKE